MSHESEQAKRAPADLALVQRFINTVELDEEPGDDEFTDPEALVSWMAERDLCEPGAAVTQAEFERALVVREGLRAVLDAHNGGQLRPRGGGRARGGGRPRVAASELHGGAPGADPGVPAASTPAWPGCWPR